MLFGNQDCEGHSTNSFLGYLRVDQHLPTFEYSDQATDFEDRSHSQTTTRLRTHDTISKSHTDVTLDRCLLWMYEQRLDLLNNTTTFQSLNLTV